MRVLWKGGVGGKLYELWNSLGYEMIWFKMIIDVMYNMFYMFLCWSVIVYDASEKAPVSWFLWRETRFCWSLARLGCRENVLFAAFEVRLRDVLDKLQYKDPNMTQLVRKLLQNVKTGCVSLDKKNPGIP